MFRVVEDSEIYRRDLDAFGAGVDLFTQTTSGTQDWLALRGTTETALEALTDAPGEGNPYFYLTGVQAKLTYAMHRLLTDHPQRWLRPCAVSSCRGFAVADGRLGQPARYCSDQCRAEGRRSQNARHQAEWRDRDAHKRERLASISLEMTVLKGALLLLEPALARYRNGGDPVTLERWLRTAIGDNVDCQPEAASVEIGRSLDGRVLSISYLTPAHGKHWRALEREAARDFRGDIARVLQLVVMKEVIEYLA